MAVTFVYPIKALNGPLLHQQLGAVSGYIQFSVGTADDGTQTIRVHCEDGTSEPSIAALITSHDATQLTAAQQAAKTAADNAATAKQQVVSIAGSAVGVAIGSLTAGQQRALLACLLWKAGAINKDGVVQPLAGWL